MQNEVLHSRKIRLPFLLLWIGGTTAGWAFGIVPLIMALNGVFWSGTDYNPNGPATACFVFFVFLAFALVSSYAVAFVQSQLLPSPLQSQKEKWALGTTIAIGAGWTLGWLGSIWPLASLATNKLVGWLVSGAIMGAAIGLLVGATQLMALRRIFPGAGWWLIASIVGWITAFAIYWLVYWLAGGSFDTITTSYYEGSLWPKAVDAPGSWPAMFAGWIAGGLVLGTVTGVAMKTLTAKSTPITTEMH